MPASEYMTIDGVSTEIDQCWHVPDYSALLAGSDQRGSDRIVNIQPGAIPYPRVETVTVVNLGVMVFGWKSKTGADHTDVRAGLVLNAAQMQQDFTKPVESTSGTRTAVLHMAGLDPLTKPVHVLGNLDFAGYGPNAMRGVMRLSFPEGLFDLTELLA